MSKLKSILAIYFKNPLPVILIQLTFVALIVGGFIEAIKLKSVIFPAILGMSSSLLAIQIIESYRITKEFEGLKKEIEEHKKVLQSPAFPFSTKVDKTAKQLVN